MTVIAISGTQGSGKSTLLNLLKEKNYKVDEFKVSRYVQQRYENLEKAVDTNLRQFQQDIFNFKYLNDSKLVLENNTLIFVERSFIDIAAYTLLWFEKLEKVSKELERWKEKYIRKCLEAQYLIYSGVINLRYNPELPFEVDENRGSFEDIKRYEELFYELQEQSGVRKLEIIDLDKDKRIESVIEFSKRISGC
jgi:predicted ATPase